MQVWNFVPIEKKHKRSEFDCGNRELNQYLSRYARQNHLKGINKAFVATKKATPLKIDGYYTISSSTIAFVSFPESERQGIPNYPIPCALIGRLAVDVSCQGQGLGGELLVDALIRIVKVSQEIGIYAVRVDAIDEKADECGLGGFPAARTRRSSFSTTGGRMPTQQLVQDAKQFYLKYEFIPFTDSSLSLFLPLKTIEKEFC